MKRWPVFVCLVLLGPAVRAESIWERRDPYHSYLVEDTRARQVGDLLTIVVYEATEFEGQEKKEYNKATSAGTEVSAAGNASLGSRMVRKFTADIGGQAGSSRKLDGKANSTIDRKFADRMTVTVVDVLPNGVLAVEGIRQRQIGRESRTLHVRGLVRPNDIGPNNTVDSSFLADFHFLYDGRGPDTNFTNQGWGGRVVNFLWPW